MRQELKYMEKLKNWREPTEKEWVEFNYSHYALSPDIDAIPNIQVMDVIVADTINNNGKYIPAQITDMGGNIIYEVKKEHLAGKTTNIREALLVKHQAPIYALVGKTANVFIMEKNTLYPGIINKIRSKLRIRKIIRKRFWGKVEQL